MDVATFRQNFTQFRTTNVDIVTAKLNEAAVRMGGPSRVWGGFAAPGGELTLADYAHGNLAAHMLSIDPRANATALDGKGTTDGQTQYLREYERYQLMVGGGFMVAGNACVGGGPFGGRGFFF
jgi:hypothetical protein